jgi:tripartite-type tricarboxylate transporter receptor subunit TctC
MMKPTAWRSLFIASFVAATATCAAGREGVFPNPRPDRTWGRTAGGIFTSGKSIAVVIGISNYIGTRAGGYPALPTAKRDADKMVDFLLNDAGFDTVYLLTDEDATKVKIDKLMTDVIPAVVTARDRFLFYWSGHGDQRFSGDGRPFGFLPVADSKSKEFYGMVSMQDLERWDRYLDARQALFVLDACLSGLAGFQTKAPLNARLEQLSLPARHLITAGTKDEIVISGDRWGGSLFTDSFILGAKGQARSPSGIVSLPVLLDFIQERVARERELVNWSKSLTPQIQSLQHGEGYFFFTPVVPIGLPPSAATSQIPEQKGPSSTNAPQPSEADRARPPSSQSAALPVNYPTKPVEIVVPFAPGGATDVVGRIMAQRMIEILGWPIVVSNVPGAGGMTGSKQIANAAADGYKIVLGTVATHAQSQSIYRKPLYTAIDFTPVALIAEFPMVLVVRKDLPINNLKEFIAYARANQSKMQYGSGGAGTESHLSCVLLNSIIGVDITHVPYRGVAPALADLISGRLDYMCAQVSTTKPPIDRGTLKPIALMSNERSKALPNVATALEQGLPNLEASNWNAIFLPKGAPADVVKKLNDASLIDSLAPTPKWPDCFMVRNEATSSLREM